MIPLEINKKIAELKNYKIEYVGGLDGCDECGNYDENMLSCSKKVDGMIHTFNCNWAENIADAFELFDEIVKTEYAFLVREKQHRHGDLWVVQIVLDYKNRIADEYYAPTAPMAICLAYIAWREKNDVIGCEGVMNDNEKI